MPSKDITAANPQGKASIKLLNDLNSFRSNQAKPKEVPEWLADYFTSLLVLSASFSFKPVFNRPYYLYLDKQQWKLSLIEPSAWNDCPYIYFAECCMHEDSSWTLQPTDNWDSNPKLVCLIKTIKKEFFNLLNTEKPLVETLPYCIQHLPYYQRLAAFGLANSLKFSLQLKLGLDKSKSLNGKQLLEQAKGTDLLKLTV